MNDFLNLSFKLNSGSFSTIAVMYLSFVVNQSGNQSERIQGLIHWASLSVLLMPVENYNFHLKITLFINTLTLALSILHATVLYFKYNVNISKCWPSHLYLCSFWTLERGAGMWGRKDERKKNVPQSTLADVPELALVPALDPRSLLLILERELVPAEHACSWHAMLRGTGH